MGDTVIAPAGRGAAAARAGTEAHAMITRGDAVCAMWGNAMGATGVTLWAPGPAPWEDARRRQRRGDCGGAWKGQR